MCSLLDLKTERNLLCLLRSSWITTWIQQQINTEIYIMGISGTSNFIFYLFLCLLSPSFSSSSRQLTWEVPTHSWICLQAGDSPRFTFKYVGIACFTLYGDPSGWCLYIAAYTPFEAPQRGRMVRHTHTQDLDHLQVVSVLPKQQWQMKADWRKADILPTFICHLVLRRSHQ